MLGNRAAGGAGRLYIACFALLALGAGSSQAAPGFDAVFQGSLTSRLDWSSDLGVDTVNTTPNAVATGAPLTQSASAVRDGRLIQTEITQVAPYVLGGNYWAASWTGSIDVPGHGFYGLSGTSSVSGHWNFSVPGQTNAQNLATVFYYASQWSVTGPAAIHPTFSAQFLVAPPLSGTQNGSFTIGNLNSFGIPGFPMTPTFEAATFALDTNGPGRVEFSYRIAFSTTPIDAGVFTTPVPEPEIYAMTGLGLGWLAWVGRRRKRITC